MACHPLCADPAGRERVRFEQRDAAACLLALSASRHSEVDEPQTVPDGVLRRLAHCSHAWILGRAAQPNEGYSAAERAKRLPQLARGEETGIEERGGVDTVDP